MRALLNAARLGQVKVAQHVPYLLLNIMMVQGRVLADVGLGWKVLVMILMLTYIHSQKIMFLSNGKLSASV